MVLGRYPFNEVVSHWEAWLSRIARVRSLTSLRSRVNRHASFVGSGARLLLLLQQIAATCFLLFLLVLVKCLWNIDDDHPDMLPDIVFQHFVKITLVYDLSTLKQLLINMLKYLQNLRLLYLLQFISWQVLHRLLFKVLTIILGWIIILMIATLITAHLLFIVLKRCLKKVCA